MRVAAILDWEAERGHERFRKNFQPSLVRHRMFSGPSSRRAAACALSPAFEHLDDDHASAAAAAWRAVVLRFVGAVGTGQNGNIQEFTGERENGLAGGAGQQTVVADAVVVDGAT